MGLKLDKSLKLSLSLGRRMKLNFEAANLPIMEKRLKVGM